MAAREGGVTMTRYDRDNWDDWDESDAEDPPLYGEGELQAVSESGLQQEWQRQCRIHDRGVDNYGMGHPVIENAQARLNKVEAEQRRRGLRTGPSWDWSD